jgi:hypothetical protein
MKLKSFGCSFTYGSDLHDCDIPQWGASRQTWPALLAKNHNLEYECHAHPGIGNLQINQARCGIYKSNKRLQLLVCRLRVLEQFKSPNMDISTNINSTWVRVYAVWT